MDIIGENSGSLDFIIQNGANISFYMDMTDVDQNPVSLTSLESAKMTISTKSGVTVKEFTLGAGLSVAEEESSRLLFTATPDQVAFFPREFAQNLFIKFPAEDEQTLFIGNFSIVDNYTK